METAVAGRDAEIAAVRRFVQHIAATDLARGAGSSAAAEAAAAAPASSRNLLLLRGSAGAGKSCVVDEAARIAAQYDQRCIRIHGAYEERDTPFYLWRAIIPKLVDVLVPAFTPRQRDAPHADAELTLRTLQRLLEANVPDSRPDDLYLLATFMDISTLALAADNMPERFAEMSGDGRGHSTATLVVELLRAACARRPLLVLVDDVHYADASSLKLIAHAATAAPTGRWVLASRDVSSRASLYSDVIRRIGTANCEIIDLGGLSREATGQLAAAIGEADAADDALVARVFEHTQGNPLFVTWLVGDLLSRGAIAVAPSPGGTKRLGIAPGHDADAVPLQPMSVRFAAEQRLAALAPLERLILRLAAVVGFVFESTALELLLREHPHVGDDLGLGAPVDLELGTSLAKLHEKNVLRIVSTGANRATVCSFVESSLLAVAYDTMLLSTRARLHKSAASHLLGSSATHAPTAVYTLARHLVRSRDHMGGWKWALDAAHRARAVHALPEAAYWYGKALAVARRIHGIATERAARRRKGGGGSNDDDEDDDNDGAAYREGQSIADGGLPDSEADPERWMVLQGVAQALRGVCHLHLGVPDRAHVDFGDSARALGTPVAATRVGKVVQMTYLLGLYVGQVRRGGKGGAGKPPRFARRALRVARDDDERNMVVEALYTAHMGLVDTAVVQLDAVRDFICAVRCGLLVEQTGFCATRPLAILGTISKLVLRSDRLFDRFYRLSLDMQPRVPVRERRMDGYLAQSGMFLVLCEWDESLALADAGLQVAETDQDVHFLRHFYAIKVSACMAKAEVGAARGAAEKQFALWTRHSDLLGGVWGIMALIIVDLFAGTVDRLEAMVEQLDEIWSDNAGMFEHNLSGQIERLGVTAHAYLLLGKPAEARGRLQAAVELLDGHRPGAAGVVWGYMSLAFVAVGLLGAAGDKDDELDQMARTLRTALRAFRKFASVAVPSATIFEAKIRLLLLARGDASGAPTGERSKLEAKLLRGIDKGNDLGMPFEVALGRMWWAEAVLARGGGDGGGQRDEALELVDKAKSALRAMGSRLADEAEGILVAHS